MEAQSSMDLWKGYIMVYHCGNEKRCVCEQSLSWWPSAPGADEPLDVS